MARKPETPEQRAKRLERQRRYRHSAKGRETYQRWMSEDDRAERKRIRERERHRNRVPTEAHRERMQESCRRWRRTEKGAANRRRYKSNPDVKAKDNVRGYFKRRGFTAAIFKCAFCSAQANHFHHHTYSQWWAVSAVCQPCHALIHRARVPRLPPCE